MKSSPHTYAELRKERKAELRSQIEAAATVCFIRNIFLRNKVEKH